MTKRVLAVGHCLADQMALQALIQRQFPAEVLRAHGWDDTLAALRAGPVDLLLVNRKLDRDQQDGVEIIRRIKADPQWAKTPCMLITNYAKHQELALHAGAEQGFGKAELDQAQTVDKLRPFLGCES